MDPKTPAKLKEAVHLDDFMSFRRETKENIAGLLTSESFNNFKVEHDQDHREIAEKVSDLENAQQRQGETMDELKTIVVALDKVIMGDRNEPNTPGMAENIRTLKTGVDTLVRHHEKENKFLIQISAKAVMILIGVIIILGGILYKALPMLQATTAAKP